jgi:hypothetical protein
MDYIYVQQTSGFMQSEYTQCSRLMYMGIHYKTSSI